MLEFLGSFIFYTVIDRPFSSTLIHFLAILGIDEEMQRLRLANNYSFILAGMVYCMRALGVEVLLSSAYRDEQGEAK